MTGIGSGGFDSSQLCQSGPNEAPVFQRGCSLNHFKQFLQPSGPEGEVEILRVVVAVGEAGVDGAVVAGNQPRAVLHTGGNVEQREAVVLRDGEAGFGRERVVLRAALVRVAAARLDEFVVDEQAAAAFADHANFQLGRAPRLGVRMRRDGLAEAVDEDVRGSAIGVAVQIIERPRGGVDVGGDGVAAVVRRAGVVDDKIFRTAMIRERPADDFLRDAVRGQIFLDRGDIELHRLANQTFQRCGQSGERRGEFAVRFDVAQQTAGLFQRRAGKRERVGVKPATGVRRADVEGANQDGDEWKD